MSTPFWLYTPLRHSKGHLPPVVLHLASCGQRRLVKNKAWTGPLGWDELALIPVESYRLCPCCRNLCSTLPPEPSRKIYTMVRGARVAVETGVWRHVL
jgi:hypothetical protein